MSQEPSLLENPENNLNHDTEHDSSSSSMTDFDSLFPVSSSLPSSSSTSSSTSSPTNSSTSQSLTSSSSSSSSTSSISPKSSPQAPSSPTGVSGPPIIIHPFPESTTPSISSPPPSSPSHVASTSFNPDLSSSSADSSSSNTTTTSSSLPITNLVNTTLPSPQHSNTNNLLPTSPTVPALEKQQQQPQQPQQQLANNNGSNGSNGVKGLKLVFGRLEFALDGQRLRIGRSEGVDILIKGDPLVSGSHCVITNGILYDPSSTNGTFINGQKMPHKREIPLHGGDLIMVGETTLSVVGQNTEQEKVLNEREAHEEPASQPFTRESVAVGPPQQSSSRLLVPAPHPSENQKEDEESSSDEEENADKEKEDDVTTIVSPTENPLAWLPSQQKIKHKSFLDQPVTSPLSDPNLSGFTSNEINHYDSNSNTYNSMPGQGELQQELVDTKRALIKERTLNTQLKRKITHQGRKQNVEKHRNMMQNYESKIHSMEFQLLYGSTKKDEEIEQLKKLLKEYQEKGTTEDASQKTRLTEELEKISRELVRVQEERNTLKEEIDNLEGHLSEVESLKKQLTQSQKEVKTLTEEQKNIQTKLLSSIHDSNLLMNKLLTRLDTGDSDADHTNSSDSSPRQRNVSRSLPSTGVRDSDSNTRVIKAIEDVRSSVKKWTTTTTVVGVILLCVALWTHYSSDGGKK